LNALLVTQPTLSNRSRELEPLTLTRKIIDWLTYGFTSNST